MNEAREQFRKRLRRHFLIELPGILLDKEKKELIDRLAQRAIWAAEDVGLIPKIADQSEMNALQAAQSEKTT